MRLPDADALARAMERVGKAFEGVTARADEDGCGRCFGAEEVALLRTPGVRLPADLVRRVARKDPFHWHDRRSVVQRILAQLVVVLAEGDDEPDLLVRGLAAAGWRGWPGEQGAAVAGFLDEWWAWTLRTGEPPVPACAVFESCVTASSSVAPWLRRWEAAGESVVARRHLADGLRWWSEELESGDSPFAWWWGSEAEARDAWQEVRAWVRGRSGPGEGSGGPA
ncbi:hypothetical protein [Streptomyces sp. NPDC086023]|uniref:hypothetical protein n=1 Tax=Streptomyces sp. NPDC086023 TaxID=3365746 RepID=UPI0037D43687